MSYRIARGRGSHSTGGGAHTSHMHTYGGGLEGKVHEVVEMSQMRQAWGTVPMHNHDLAQELVGSVTPTSVRVGECTRLQYPWQEQVQWGHELWERGCGLPVHTDPTVILYL